MDRNLKARRPDLHPARIDRTVSMMVTHFPETLVTDHGDLIPSLQVHEGDRHVLTAAIRVGAAVIVTWNRSHFPEHACQPYAVAVQDPDEFLCRLRDLDSREMALVLKEQAEHLVNPPRTALQVAETLYRSVPRFAATAIESGLFTS